METQQLLNEGILRFGIESRDASVDGHWVGVIWNEVWRLAGLIVDGETNDIT
jgi:hypothetical protein